MVSLRSHLEKVFPSASNKYQKIYSDDEDSIEKSSSVAPPASAASPSMGSKSSTESEQVSFPPIIRRRFSTCSILILFFCFSAITGSVFWVLSQMFGETTLRAAKPASESPQLQVQSNETGAGNDTQGAGSPFRKALVVASFSKQNVGWLADIPSDWEVARYILDDPNPYHALTVPRNQGREAMAYLTYIIDNYDNFPDAAVFVHGHFRSWHQPEKVTNKIKAINMTALQQEQYFSLRCTASPGCDGEGLNTIDPVGNHDALMHMRAWWETIFPPGIGNLTFDDGGPRQTGELPVMVRGKCCAQFAVSREAVRQMPLDIWKRIRAPLLRDVDDFAAWGDGVSSHALGLLYEPVWHIIFGKSGEHCPSEDYCRKVFFSDAIHCDHYTTFGETEDMSHCHSIFDDDKSHLLGETTGQGVPSDPGDDQSSDEAEGEDHGPGEQSESDPPAPSESLPEGGSPDIPPRSRKHKLRKRGVLRAGKSSNAHAHPLARQPISRAWAEQYLRDITSPKHDQEGY